MPESSSPFAHRSQGRPSLTAEAVTLARALEQLKPDPGIVDDARLAAGYDMRADRLAEKLAGRPVYEVDLPAISQQKAATIGRKRDRFPEANVVRVEIDFEQQSLATVLAEAGLDVGAKTFVTWEGVPMYLTRAAVKATLDAVFAVTGPGSVIAHDMWTVVDDPGPMGTARRLAPNAVSFIGEPVTFCVHPEEIGAFYGNRGFDVIDIVSGEDLLERYSPNSRALVDPSMYALAAERRP